MTRSESVLSVKAFAVGSSTNDRQIGGEGEKRGVETRKREGKSGGFCHAEASAPAHSMHHRASGLRLEMAPKQIFGAL